MGGVLNKIMRLSSGHMVVYRSNSVGHPPQIGIIIGLDNRIAADASFYRVLLPGGQVRSIHEMFLTRCALT